LFTCTLRGDSRSVLLVLHVNPDHVMDDITRSALLHFSRFRWPLGGDVFPGTFPGCIAARKHHVQMFVLLAAGLWSVLRFVFFTAEDCNRCVT